MHEVVRDGNRSLRFDGEKLAFSSSRVAGNDRWVEFALYRTMSGTYVLSRVGQTLLYHALDCSIVQRNNLKASDIELLSPEHVPCGLCRPEEDTYIDVIALEKPRYFALTSESPEAVLDALYMDDRRGGKYLTNVAERLMEDACALDARLEQAYRVEYID